ncbi:MAG: hypothetical protein J6N54_11425, partial [Bacteroidales bacterium]|nr:hypothetical protein [Bacteroidales bacterium]
IFAFVRQVFHILNSTLAVTLLLLTLVTAPGLSLVRCAHTGKIYLEEFSESDCGLADADKCMEHFTLQIQGNIKAPTFQAPATHWATLIAVPVNPAASVELSSSRPCRFQWHHGDDPPDQRCPKITYLRI